MSDEDLEILRQRLVALGRPYRPDDVADQLRAMGVAISDSLMIWVLDRLRRGSVGAGPLEPLLQIPGVTDVLVNGPGQVWIDRGQGLERSEVAFDGPDEVRRLAARLAATVGRRLDEASPWVDARLPDGTRVHAVLDVVADPGTCLSLRVPARRRMSLQEYVDRGSISERCGHLLTALMSSKVPFLISGGTGSGKTTLLAALLSLVPDDERLVIVEDSRELAPVHTHCVRLEARLPNAEGAGAVTLTDLVRQALRMRPDRLVLGEARGAELVDLLMAMNTGHEGGCGTVHANSVADVPARLEALAALGGLSRQACHAQVRSAIQVVVHLRRWSNRQRGVAEIGLVCEVNEHAVVLPAISFSEHGDEVRGDLYDDLVERIGA